MPDPTPEPPRRYGTLAVFGIAILLNLVVSVLVLDQLARTRGEMRALSEEFATKQDLASLRPLGVRRILDDNCTSCHTDRLFVETLAMEPSEIHRLEVSIPAHAEMGLSPAEVARVDAALLVNRCTTCHDETVLSRLLLKSHPERIRYLRQKVAMPGSGFRSDQVGELVGALRLLAESG